MPITDPWLAEPKPIGGNLPDVRIEAVTDQDAGELLTLQRAAYVSEARLYGDLEIPPMVQTLAELRAELATAQALKAVAGHRIVGAIRAVAKGAVPHVGRLTVAPNWQGRGVGSLLMAAVEERREQLNPAVVLVHLTKLLPQHGGHAGTPR